MQKQRSSFAASLLALSLLAVVGSVTTGCAVSRGQETMGSYVDDTSITTAVKARFVQSPEVDASAIGVETMQGTVMLSGFARSATESRRAEELAWKSKGVIAVKNQLVVRP